MHTRAIIMEALEEISQLHEIENAELTLDAENSNMNINQMRGTALGNVGKILYKALKSLGGDV